MPKLSECKYKQAEGQHYTRGGTVVTRPSIVQDGYVCLLDAPLASLHRAQWLSTF